MKDGGTHLAHKAEHAVDMDSGAVLAVTLQHADVGDTTTIYKTVTQQPVEKRSSTRIFL
jgi:transposase